MITVCRSDEREHIQGGRHEVWLTFSPEGRADALAGGFGTLRGLTECRFRPGAGIAPYPQREAEIVTYVREGALASHDSGRRPGIVSSGEFRRLTAGRGIRRSETNASRTTSAQSFEFDLEPQEAELDPSHEQKRFSAAERRGKLCVVASPDGRRGSLHVHQDALLYSALVCSGQHLVHELFRGRSAWLHLVQGEVTLDDVNLTSGDGAGFVDERVASFTAWAESEILLLNLVAARPRACTNGRVH